MRPPWETWIFNGPEAYIPSSRDIRALQTTHCAAPAASCAVGCGRVLTSWCGARHTSACACFKVALHPRRPEFLASWWVYAAATAVLCRDMFGWAAAADAWRGCAVTRFAHEQRAACPVLLCVLLTPYMYDVNRKVTLGQLLACGDMCMRVFVCECIALATWCEACWLRHMMSVTLCLRFSCSGLCCSSEVDNWGSVLVRAAGVGWHGVGEVACASLLRPSFADIQRAWQML